MPESRSIGFPKKTIPILLTRGIEDERPLHAHPDQPFRVLEDWVKASVPGTPDVIERRSCMLDSALQWGIQNKNAAITLRALCIALCPAFGEISPVPGSGRSIRILSGYVTTEELDAIRGLWPRVRSFLQGHRVEDLRPVQEAVEDWAFPGRANAPTTEETRRALRSHALAMLRDLVAITHHRPSVQHWAKMLARNLRARIRTHLDPEFAVLFPIRDFRNWQQAQQKYAAASRKLAKRWATRAPHTIAKRIVAFEREAGLNATHIMRCTPLLCFELASRVRPAAWLDALIRADAPPDCVSPLLERVIHQRLRGWQGRLRTCLKRPSLRGIATSIILRMPAPPRRLLDDTIANLTSMAGLVEMLCMNRAIPQERMHALLNHEDRAIAAAAAQGEWHAQPEGGIRESLRQDWRAAVIRAIEDHYGLEAMFRSDSMLPVDWLRERIRTDSRTLFMHDRETQVACAALTSAQRCKLLEAIPERFTHGNIVGFLIGDDIPAYRALLAIPRLAAHHLNPLSGIPTQPWIEKAVLALDAGYSPERIARSIRIGMHNSWWRGEESDRWAGLIERFERLRNHPDARIRRVGEIGGKESLQEQSRAIQEERHEAVYGLR